jgi:hypothetical protein
MMTASGEPSGYYPMDSNGLAVQSEPPVACVCYVAAGLDVCAPLGYNSCSGSEPNPCNSPYTDFYLAMLAAVVCLPAPPFTPCSPQQRQECSRFCRGRGGIMTGCIVRSDGKIGCICSFECNEDQWRACERDCQNQGRGSAIGCMIVKGYILPGGEEVPGGRRCECEQPSR